MPLFPYALNLNSFDFESVALCWRITVQILSEYFSVISDIIWKNYRLYLF